MADPKAEVASAYGEGEIEAAAMTETAVAGVPAAPVPASGVATVGGTTETDVAANQREVAERSAAD